MNTDMSFISFSPGTEYHHQIASEAQTLLSLKEMKGRSCNDSEERQTDTELLSVHDFLFSQGKEMMKMTGLMMMTAVNIFFFFSFLTASPVEKMHLSQRENLISGMEDNFISKVKRRRMKNDANLEGIEWTYSSFNIQSLSQDEYE